MSRIDTLRRNYQRVCGLPWDRRVAGPQRVWVAVYDTDDERKLRLGIGLFEEATLATGHRWLRCDLTDAFADWLCRPDNLGFAASYFESPELLDDGPLAEFQESVASQIVEAMRALDHPSETVVAITGVASLFGFTRISQVLPLVEPYIQGRLLVFFPGVYENNNYRLLDARDGWNYLAVPITTHEGELRG
jgi:Domain of unknown function (DUF1788)